MDNRRVSSRLHYTTIRILTSRQANCNWTGSGTGFLYRLERQGVYVPILVSNKHVLDGAALVGLTFHTTLDGYTPLPGAGRLFYFLPEGLILRHPDTEVDLAAIALGPILEHITKTEGWQPYLMMTSKVDLPSPKMLADMSPLEEVIMVGYPNGIVDDVNNIPIIRRGITSTPYAVDYNGRREFLADISVYPGSSGSPIFVMNEGSWSVPNGVVMGTRVGLLGILYAGHTINLTGEVAAEPVPTELATTASIRQMINLGICIKSALIEDLADIVPFE